MLTLEKILEYKKYPKDELISIIVGQDMEIDNIRNKFDEVLKHIDRLLKVKGGK